MDKFRSIKVRRTMLSLAVAGICAPSAVLAEESKSHLEEVMVWGASVNSSSEALSSDDFALKQADHMSDLLRDIPGVDVGGTHSVNQRINIRGMGETDLDIRLDGASQNANMFHHVGNLTLNPDIIRSADIQVGANSVTSGALGGAVYFETKDAKDLLRYDETFGARIYGGYGSNAFATGSLTTYGKLGENADALVYLYGIKRDNFKDGNGDETFGAEGKVNNLLAKAGWDLSDTQRIEFSYDYYKDHGDYNPRPNWGAAGNATRSKDALIDTRYTRHTYTLGYEWTTEKHLLEASLYQNKIDLHRNEVGVPGFWPADRVGENTGKNTNTGAQVKGQSNLALSGLDQTLVYGYEYKKQDTENEYAKGDTNEASLSSHAIYLEDKTKVVESVDVTISARYDYIDRETKLDNSSYNKVTWAGAVDWHITSNITLFASTKTLFKAPELIETFINYEAKLAQDLKPETGYNHQGGVKFNQEFGAHTLGANLTLFQTRVNDYILKRDVDPSRAVSYEFQNVDDAEFTGFEASVNYAYDALLTRVSYSRSNNKFLESGEPINTQDRSARSTDIGDSISLNLEYAAYDLDLLVGWNSNFVLEESNVLEGKPAKEAYNVHKLYAQWAPSQVEGLALTFGIDNLFDAAYVSHASTTGSSKLRNGSEFALDDLEPGRNVKLSVAYQF
ncbi:TonB-dependent siderophore receptor [Vibrio nigripulchritudo]|uniref:TonB-dependent siderophore receptor n=1 Tax=Vibrio nigripulchritudo TaxID=28173 RepID=UPI0003B1C9B1|nr:TonB-dependent siderophore receptor [Vibrio nigripulchritudo]CCN71389.1 Enterobactin receptor [Vibrio nigripulchritudo SFn118]